MDDQMKEKMEKEGTLTPLPESIEILYEAVPAPFKHLRHLFRAVSEQNKKELTAMIDINWRTNYKHGGYDAPERLKNFAERIEQGELPSALVRET